MICTYSDVSGYLKCAAIQLGGAILVLTIMGIVVLFLFSISNKK